MNYEQVLNTFKTVDVETTGLKHYNGDRPFLYQLGDMTEILYCSDPDTKTIVDYSNLVKPDVFKEIKRICEDETIPLCGHNIAFDIGMLNSVGIQVNGMVIDTAVLAHLYNENLLKRSLEALTEIFVPEYTKDDGVKAWFKKHKIKKADWKFDMVDQDVLVPYALQDITATHALALHLMPKIHKMGLWDLFVLEMQTLKVLVKMHARGHLLDVPYLYGLKGAYEKKIAKIEEEIKAVLPKGLNYGSPIQLARFFIAEGFTLPKTNKDNYQVNEEVLKGLDHPVAKLIMELRGENKILKTYVINLLEATDKDGILHPSFNQSKAVTGRFTSNVQQYPKKDTTIRKAFIPRPGYINVAIDYAQMEYRVFIDYAKDDESIEKVINGLDVHQYTADKLGLKDRGEAKKIVFGTIYGMTKYGLAYDLGISVDKADKILKGYFKLNPKQANFIERVGDTINGSYVRKVTKRGWVKNRFGRRRTPPRMRKGKIASNEKKRGLAVNSLIQGVCSDIMRRAMVRCDKLLENYDANILLQIHDELIFEMKIGLEDELIPKLITIMEENKDMFKVPLPAEADLIVDNWGEKTAWVPKEEKAEEEDLEWF